MNIVEFVVAGLALILTCAMIATAPRWFSRSLHRHRLWHLRDNFVDDVIAKRLPADHPAIQQLLWHLRSSLDNGPGNRALDITVFRWAKKSLSPAARQELATRAGLCSTEGLTPEQMERVKQYREQFETLLVGMLMLGSIWGTLIVVRFLPSALAMALSEAKTKSAGEASVRIPVKATVKTATDSATRSTRAGRGLREELESDPWGLLAPVPA
jgi:hypothetical protein